jgi:hypothetical protein
MRQLRRASQRGVLLRHPTMTLALLFALIAGPSALWYVHTHPVRHTEVCSYRSYRYKPSKGTQSIPVYVPVYCNR